tara:strand:+ start:138 stop:521 length:384 start_codon:yes stop_codon:yes gene_type:complete
MWAVGVVLFILLGGYHPFDPDGLADDKKMAKAILACRWAFDDPAWDEVHYLLTYYGYILGITCLLWPYLLRPHLPWPHYLLCLHFAWQVGDEAKAVVKSLLAPSAAKRPSAPQLLAMPWVKGEGRWP